MCSVFRVKNVLLGAKRSADFRVFQMATSTRRFFGTTLPVCCVAMLNTYPENKLNIVPDRSCRRSYFLPSRHFHSGVRSCQKMKSKEESKSRDLVEGRETPFSELTRGQKVKQAGKDAAYTGIIIGGVAVTGFMFYAIGRELFSGQSPSGIYSRAFKMCRKNEQVIDAIGEPIKGYGEMTSRGRRRFVKHVEYEVDGIKFMRMQFYLEGPLNKGTVHLEVKQDDRRKYQFLYVLVELSSYPHRTIVVEDNRYAVA